uniref:Uncharacterized protein n=1 Tax=Callorhinchus milii TaxID=7868 RepID=A0A4W3GNZ3_CALMI|eukprot:gi/632933672/ref/XP_007896383.1/ PREDICTED: uncharacterized protein C1orf131 homolog [Callorhinchus milii]
MEDSGGESSGGEGTEQLLDTIVKHLYQFGEAAIDDNKQKETKKIKPEKVEEKIVCSDVADQDNQMVPCTRILSRTNSMLTMKALKPIRGAAKCLAEMQAELLNPAWDCAMPTETKNISTDNGNLTVNKKRQVEVVTFTDPSNKRKKLPPVTEEDQKMEQTNLQNDKEQKIFNLEKTRLEVHRFGITGYKKEEQRVFEKERAIMLGAKPPKREYVNYKDYQEFIKKKAIAEQEMKMNPNLPQSKKKKKTERRTKRKTDIVPTGQVGRFKNGALVLSDRDIKRIKASSR